MGNKGLKKGILVVFLANIINLVLSMVKSFVLPKYLSVDAYAGIKTYQLYISYAGLAALGYIDGMYLKYGGKDINKINKKEFLINLSTFRLLELLVSLLIFIFGIIFKDLITILVAVTIFAMNITDYFKCFFQATGEFSFYSKIMNISSVLMFLANMGLIFIFKSDDYIYYLISYVFVYYIVWISLEVYNKKTNSTQATYTNFSWNELTGSVTSGFALMCGLLLSNFMTGLDRWFIKFTMETYVFALYSFAATVEGFLSYAISPISITLYNYFCKNREINHINTIRQYIVIFSCIIVSSAFAVKFILEFYIPKYYDCVDVLFILFSGQIIYAIIRCFYINIYKADKKQNRYFINIIKVVICGFLFNVILFIIMHRVEAYAIGTFLSAIVWLELCDYDYREYKFSKQEFLFIVISILSMNIYGIYLSSYVGFILYILTITVSAFLLLRTSFKGIINLVCDTIMNKMKFIREVN